MTNIFFRWSAKYAIKVQYMIAQKILTYQSAKNILLKEITQGGTVEISDGNYLTCDQDLMQNLIDTIPIKRREYIPTTHDCENFAKEFWGMASALFPQLPIGYCHVITKYGKHAANFCIYKDKNTGRAVFTYIEPQTGKLSYTDWKPYILIV